MEKGSILVIDDDVDILTSAQMFLEQHFSNVCTETNPGKIKQNILKGQYDVILLDMNFKKGEFDGSEGLLWMDYILKKQPEVVVVLMTAFGEVELAVEAMKKGAFDFILKPWKNAKLLGTLMAAFKHCKSKQEIEVLQNTQKKLTEDIGLAYNNMIGKSDAMEKVFNAINKVAKTDANVLILGENGTGKELVARAIHRASLRKDKVFIGVDLGSLSETLFESEMFGHVKGAFTDAKTNKPGRFELANEGTIFLDEIGNLSLSLQSKLLTVLQSRKISRIGSTKDMDLNIRLIAATNMPLYEMVKNSEFRQDLLYRINTVELTIPPLRDRKDDIPLLLNHFISVYKKKYKKTGLKLQKRIYTKLNNYSWPGNVRELQNLVERAVILCDNDQLTVDDFILKTNESELATKQENLNIKEVEKQLIIQAIEKHKGNITRAAEELGINRNALYRRMEKHGI